MSDDQILILMKSSKSQSEWNRNCDCVKKAFNNDYPKNWYSLIIHSGVLNETRRINKW